MNEPIIGVNIEDNHISVGLVNIETRKIVPNSVQRKRIDPLGSADQIIATWSKVLKDVAGNSKKIGISLPGVCDYETGVFHGVTGNRYDSLKNQNFKEVFSGIIGSDSSNVKMMNDAVCFLQGEVFVGSGRGFKSSLGVTLGLGLGSAIYSNGVVTDAELYNYPLYDGVSEDYISIRWLLRRFNELTGIEAKDLTEIRQYADTNPAVAQIFEEFATSISVFLERFIYKHNPEVVVIGGFMEVYNRYFFDSLTEKMSALGIKIPVLRAILGEQASIIGAASSWYNASQLHV